VTTFGNLSDSFSNKYAIPLFYFGIALIIIGLLFSKALISIGSFVLLGQWLLTGKLKEKWGAFVNNKTAVVVSLTFAVHLIGMSYTSDWNYGLKDLRVKLPLLLFPLIFSTSTPLTTAIFRKLQLLFVVAVATSTFISLAYWLMGPEVYGSDKRNLSLFVSHIRLGLMVCLAFFICLLELKKSMPVIGKTFLIVAIIWFPLFLLLMESLGGLFILVAVSAVYIAKLAWTKRRSAFILLFFIGLAITVWGGFRIVNYYQFFAKLQQPKTLPFKQFSAGGEAYAHPDIYAKSPSRQNGYLVYQNIAWKELIRSWNERSDIDFDSTTHNNYPIKHVVLWFLTSKGLEKDSAAVYSLTNQEVKAIEQGLSNVHYMQRSGFVKRIYQTCWELNHYLNGGDYNGHSVAMRLAFWKTGFSIFKDNWLIGVGTGDIKSAFKQQYEKEQSILTDKWRLRSHNQYLSLAIAFGIVGALIIYFSFFYPLVRYRTFSPYLLFSCIVFLSMLSEDTIETQVGVTFFAFFNAFYLFLRPSSLSTSK
jgi:hypothetical protein